MKKILLVAFLAGCGDGFVAQVDGPCAPGYERRDYYPRDAVWCGPIGNDAGFGSQYQACAPGWHTIGWAGMEVRARRAGGPAVYGSGHG
jgi:hypothetical protein